MARSNNCLHIVVHLALFANVYVLARGFFPVALVQSELISNTGESAVLQNITLASLHLYKFYPIEKAIVVILAELACARFNSALVIPTVERDKRV